VIAIAALVIIAVAVARWVIRARRAEAPATAGSAAARERSSA
jgi:hypothetical protein